MGADSSWPLQQAVYTTLTGDATLMALIAGVHDHVPQDSAFPLIVIGDEVDEPFGTKTFDGSTAVLTLHVWDQFAGATGTGRRGRKRIKDVQSRLRDLLHHATLAVTGHTLIDTEFLDAFAFEEDDGLTTHGVVRFRAVTQPT